MNYLYLISGIIIAAWGFTECLWTTLWVDGTSAPLTGRFTTLIWKGMRATVGKKRHKLLSLAGPVILITTVSAWIIMIILGWSLIFYADPNAIKNSTTSAYPDFFGHIWYVTYVTFSVGNGDFTPVSDTWQLLSALVAFGGMGVVTLAVTYLLQVLSAVVTKRSFSSQVTSIGKGSEDLVISQWTGDSFGQMELQLSSLSTTLAKLTEQHMAYPVLHYYHAASAQKSVSLALTLLDEALTIIRYGTPRQYQPAGTIIASTRSSVQSFLDTLGGAYISPSHDVPPLPDLQKLREKGVPTLSDGEFQKQLGEMKKRRRMLSGYVQNSAWYWPPIKEEQHG